MKEAYFNKTMERLGKIEDLVPFGRERSIWINGKECRNIYFYKRELEKKLETLTCETFRFIHGDCTFPNLMIRRDKSPVLIDPRGYFGFTELYGDVFTVLKAGLYERACGIGFCEYGAHSSRFTEADSGSWVDAVKLDDVAANEKVSFIKFDLEGADIPALKGSEQTIKRWKPKLALSIYHNIEDLWEIPLMVKRMLPEYRLFVRHHTIFLWDKILYAAIEEDLAQ